MGVGCLEVPKVEENFNKEKTEDEINKLNMKRNQFENIKKKFNYDSFFENSNHSSFSINQIILIEKLNIDLEEINNRLNISVNGLIIPELISKEINDKNVLYGQLKKNIQLLSNNITCLSNSYEKIEDKNKQKENIIKNIQQKFDEIKVIDNSEESIKILKNNVGIISNQLNILEEHLKSFENDIITYNNKKEELNKSIEKIQDEIKNYKINIENLINKIIKESEYDFKTVDEKFIKNSMLLFSKENPKDIFQSKLIFNTNNKEEKKYKPTLLYKNWNEKCYINNDYDIHDINFELKAVGLPGKICLNRCSIGLSIDSSIEIMVLEINGLEVKYELNNYSIKFAINLGNEESNSIHLKYKEIPLLTNLTEGEKKERNFCRCKFYGIKKYVQNQNAKFTLINESDFEIINFDNDFLVKKNENEYIWGGIVPIDGKRTIVRFSKPEGRFIFEIKEKIENLDKNPLLSEKLIVPFYLEGGNNNITQLLYSSEQTDKITKNENAKNYEVNFINTNESIGIFSIKYQFVNRLKGEWKCDLTDDEIESKIPKDFKENKKLFKQMADNIIEKYKEEHKNDLIEITEMAIIGKWVKNNIKYDINYLNSFEITAIETLKNKIGSHFHITQLYNALMFSLGYKCIFVSGLILKKSNIYNEKNYHSWSLIKVNDKWLPFDPTFGIFTGKLPVTHVFISYFIKVATKDGSDDVIIREKEICGKILD